MSTSGHSIHVAASFGCRKMASKDVEFKGEPKKAGIGGKFRATGQFLYNKESGDCLGRSCKSWGKITVFYLIFYSCLAAFFAIMMVGFFQTVDDKMPSQTGMNSLIKGNPGMGFKPRPDVETTLVMFKQGPEDEGGDYNGYDTDITAFLATYNETDQSNGVDCSELAPGTRAPEDFCIFDFDSLGTDCTESTKYGYIEGAPCVLLKMNKIWGWQPEPFENETDLIEAMQKEAGSPIEDVAKRFKPGNVFITCQGENPGDQDALGPVIYNPPEGFPANFFPFQTQDGFLAPLVFAQFTKPTAGTLIQVWCKAWAKNIFHHKNDRAGSLHFELLAD